MRLHIAHNEKVIERCINNFEGVYPGGNKWIVFNNVSGVDYVLQHENVIKCSFNSKLFWDSIGEIEQYEKIIIHYLSKDSAKFICKIKHPAIYWIEWGGDLYNGLLRYRGFDLYSEIDIEWKTFGRHYPKFFFHFVQKLLSFKSNRLYLKAIRKVKYFVPDSMYNEYPLLLDYYPELSHLQYREFFYYPIDEVLGVDFKQRVCKGTNIILGNSASLTGNHCEVLKILSKMGGLSDRKVIIPLSYGPIAYRNYVINMGNELLGDSITAVTNYMPLEKYNRLLESASVFIYNNYRQEAVGNILVALFLGGRVFLNKKNPLLNFYKTLGLSIFEIDEFDSKNTLTPLSDEEREKNRKILLELYSRDRLLSLIKNNM